MKVLLTFIGFNDPYSKSVVAGEEKAGPILSLLAAREFDRVILFASPGTLASADELASTIQGSTVQIVPLNLPDPTDYVAILGELRRECGTIRDQNLDAEFFVATASGTPQMHACWFLLTASGELPATLLHVRPQRFVTNDLPQVEEIIPSGNQFPRVLPNVVVSTAETDPKHLLNSALESAGILVTHQSTRKLAERGAIVAPIDTTVLVQGETGTGKEMFAQLIHTLSKRQGRLVALNCGAIPNNLVESTLFGHERGSFTGAVNKQAGKFQEADRGTLFLDEIGEMPMDSQVALLRVLQDQMIQPLGASQPHKVDVRVIAATNRNLLEEVKQGRFREDLYYRLCPITLKIPPLRERRSEIAPIAIFILERLNRSFRRQRRFSPAALRKITSYSWPGNVRQLDGVLRSAVILAENDLIDAEDLDLGATSSNFQLPEPGEGFNMEDFLAEARVHLIRRALEISDGNQAAAGRLLGTSGQNVSKFLKSKANAG